MRHLAGSAWSPDRWSFGGACTSTEGRGEGQCPQPTQDTGVGHPGQSINQSGSQHVESAPTCSSHQRELDKNVTQHPALPGMPPSLVHIYIHTSEVNPRPLKRQGNSHWKLSSAAVGCAVKDGLNGPGCPNAAHSKQRSGP